MTELGDLFEATYAAPRCRTVHAQGNCWTDHGHIQRAVNEWTSGTEIAVLTFSSAGSGSGDPPAASEAEPFELWWRADGRLRVERSGGVEVRAGSTITTFHPLAGAVERVDEEGRPPSLPVALSARAVLADLDFRLPESSSWHGRATWTLVGSPGGDRGWRPFPFWAHDLPGGEYELQIDKLTGLIVSIEGRFDQHATAWMRLESLDVDGPIDDAVFVFEPPDGVPVRTPEQLLVEHLREQGVDLSDIDVSDRDQVHQALRRHTETLSSFHRRASVDELAQDVPVLGPPPADEAAALAQVTDAFARMDELSPDGRDLLLVERGEGLGDCLRAAGQQVRGAKGTFDVRHVKFVSDREAVVWYQVRVDGRPVLAEMEGRAVHLDDRWLVTRATFCQLMRLAGVTCPPPTAGP